MKTYTGTYANVTANYPQSDHSTHFITHFFKQLRSNLNRLLIATININKFPLTVLNTP